VRGSSSGQPWLDLFSSVSPGFPGRFRTLAIKSIVNGKGRHEPERTLLHRVVREELESVFVRS
jgi:hypothetical protein